MRLRSAADVSREHAAFLRPGGDADLDLGRMGPGAAGVGASADVVHGSTQADPESCRTAPRGPGSSLARQQRILVAAMEFYKFCGAEGRANPVVLGSRSNFAAL